MKKSTNSNESKPSGNLWRIENSDRQVLSSLPKFLALTKKEKSIFFQTLSDGRDNAEKIAVQDDRDGQKQKCDDPVPAVPSGNSTRFDALTENEKYIFFATLKNASTKKEEKSYSVRDVLSVAVEVISKDNKRIKRSDSKKRRIQHEELDDEEENRLLLSILERREEQEASTKTNFQTRNSKTRSTSLSKKLGNHTSNHFTESSAQNDFTPTDGASSSFSEVHDSARCILSSILNRIGSEERVSGESKNETERTNEAQAEDEISKDGRPSEEILETETDLIDRLEKFSKESSSLGGGLADVTQAGLPVAKSDPREFQLEDSTISRRSASSIPVDSQKQEKKPETFESIVRETKPEGLEDAPTKNEIVEVGEISRTEDEENRISTSSVDVRRSLEETASFAEDEEISERKREPSRSDSEASKTSAEFEDTEEEECVAVRDKRLTAPRSRVRTLQDLLKDRAVLSVDSSDRFRIQWLPRQEFLSNQETEEFGFHDRVLYEQESRKERRRNKIFYYLQKLFTCGRKEIEKEDVVAENLKGESVSVETAIRQRNAATATLEDATMEVLEAAKRKRIIAQYSNK